MKYFSMFSGVEGFGQGIEGEPVGFSEIDKYASMVLKYRFPKVKNYGDCSTIKWEQVADFDMLVGGSPCQDFSIAGKGENSWDCGDDATFWITTGPVKSIPEAVGQ